MSAEFDLNHSVQGIAAWEAGYLEFSSRRLRLRDALEDCLFIPRSVSRIV
jgi:hypothetical protein